MRAHAKTPGEKMAGNVSGTDFVHEPPSPVLCFVGLHGGKEVKLFKFL